MIAEQDTQIILYMHKSACRCVSGSIFPNIQNQVGITDIIDKVRRAKKVDDKNLFVASRIPTGDDENNAYRRIEKFAEELRIDECINIKVALQH